MIDVTPTQASTAPPEATEAPTVARPIDKRVWYVVAAAIAGIGIAFLPLFKWLPTLWFKDDSYYAHGAVVPICAGLILWDRWAKIKSLPIKGQNWAAIPLLGLLYVLWFALRTDMHTFESGLLLVFLCFSVLFVAGWQWLKGLAIPIGYLSFGLPLFDRFVDTYTQPIQTASTNLAFKMLQVGGQEPFRIDASSIIVGDFTFDVGVVCSGMKLLLAVIAICAFFVLVARLKWWGNAILVSAVIPLTLVVNSLRIALIGWVGSQWGSEAGHQFHDYSGYISLVVCFLLLMQVTRWLGWK